ncbi:MAG: acyl-CoA thioesterase [Candidatus Margulisbacteria bacterium]|nr:acyl-CoA thioesterase [Candidatus Margulisiibacteriota bacterium]
MNEYQLDLTVRDYECDLQGIVNNATYLNYLEHTRHEFLKSVGIDFALMHQKGIDLVVVRSEIDYKSPLKSGDKFYVTLKMAQEGKIRFVFYQDIYRAVDDKPIIKGKITGTALSGAGRPFLPDELKNLIENYSVVEPT